MRIIGRGNVKLGAGRVRAALLLILAGLICGCAPAGPTRPQLVLSDHPAAPYDQSVRPMRHQDGETIWLVLVPRGGESDRRLEVALCVLERIQHTPGYYRSYQLEHGVVLEHGAGGARVLGMLRPDRFRGQHQGGVVRFGYNGPLAAAAEGAEEQWLRFEVHPARDHSGVIQAAQRLVPLRREDPRAAPLAECMERVLQPAR